MCCMGLLNKYEDRLRYHVVSVSIAKWHSESAPSTIFEHNNINNRIKYLMDVSWAYENF